jgi:predicted transposase YbfD/YdcC
LPKKTACLIVENGGDYLIALKKNQKNLHLFAGALLDARPLDFAGQLECGHGRIEQRNLRIAPLDSDISPFPHARQVLSCTRIYTSKNGGETKTETRYFITSIEPGKRTHQQLAASIRQHWSIENLNHWKRDSSMWREDRSSLRCAKGAKNLALLRNAALAILPFEQHSTLNAAFDHYRDYRGKSLKLIKTSLPFPE